MGTVSKAESTHMYSWWWASHISPKNSKWLQENLTDMDSKVKMMIKLIEVDEDSFARRAEMYYKKRPELMKLVEEIYRAYRALAERYDHATGVIRHAHKAVSEAFPNQVHFLDSDDGSLIFHDAENGAQDLSQSERLERSETDIKALKEALAKLEAEKEAGLLWYQESMQRLSNLESEVLRTAQLKTEKEAVESIADLENKVLVAEDEAASLKEALARISEEYQQCLTKIASLEKEIALSREEAEKLKERNMFLANSLFDVNAELAELRAKSVSLEDSCRLLNDEKSILVNGRRALEKKHAEFCVLQELVEKTRGQLGEELDKATNAEFETFILQQTLQELRRTNCFLLETSNLSEKLVSKLEHENTEQKEEVRLLSDQVTGLRMGMFELLKVLEVDLDHVPEDNANGDQTVLHKMLVKLDDTRQSLCRASDENQKLVIENSVLVTLLRQLKQEFSERNKQLSSLHGDILKLLHSNASEIESLRAKLQESELGIVERSASLEKYDDKMKEMKTAQSQLECEFVNAKAVLCKKEMELLEAEALIHEQRKQIKESEWLQETMQNLQVELCRMQEEHNEANRVVETLRSDLKMGKDEAEVTFVELQNSSVLEVLYKEKLFELTAEYQCLVDKHNFGGLELVQLKEKNSEVEAQWDGYVPAMATTRDAVASLERRVMSTETDNGDNEDVTTTTTTATTSDVTKQQLNQTPEPQEAGDELAMKDIMLDEASETSSSRKNIKDTWYNNIESDEQIIPTPPGSYYHHNNNNSSEIPDEKELRVDSLELSKRHVELNEANAHKKILDRLSSDVEKLTKLQITVQDLKAKGAGYADVKEQLEESERAIVKLMDESGKIVNCCSIQSAKRWCEKVGRLEVEVEKIRFLVVKLEGSNKVVERGGRKVVLRDYLYGSGAHTRWGRRKARLCACVLQPGVDSAMNLDETITEDIPPGDMAYASDSSNRLRVHARSSKSLYNARIIPGRIWTGN